MNGDWFYEAFPVRVSCRNDAQIITRFTDEKVAYEVSHIDNLSDMEKKILEELLSEIKRSPGRKKFVLIDCEPGTSEEDEQLQPYRAISSLEVHAVKKGRNGFSYSGRLFGMSYKAEKWKHTIEWEKDTQKRIAHLLENEDSIEIEKLAIMQVKDFLRRTQKEASE